MKAKPFVKWAGGKRRLLKYLVPKVLEAGPIETYYEPFLGGGALFFELSNLDPRPFKRAVLSDMNEELIVAYRGVRDRIDRVLYHLSRFAGTQREYADLVHNLNRATPLGDSYRAARFIFLNRTSYGGLWRVNSKGQYNTPYNPKHGRIVFEDELRAASKALQGVELRHEGFGEATLHARRGDFIYADPPYFRVASSAPHKYTQSGFTNVKQKSLRSALGLSGLCGAKWIASNSDTDAAWDLYRDFPISRVSCSRPINSDTKKRGQVSELIITSW